MTTPKLLPTTLLLPLALMALACSDDEEMMDDEMIDETGTDTTGDGTGDSAEEDTGDGPGDDGSEEGETGTETGGLADEQPPELTSFRVNGQLDPDPVYEASFVGLAAAAYDDVGVDTVEFYVDGNFIGADTEAPYMLDWPLTAQPEGGVHVFEAVALDAAGNEASAILDCTISLPAAGSTMWGLGVPSEMKPAVAVFSFEEHVEFVLEDQIIMLDLDGVQESTMPLPFPVQVASRVGDQVVVAGSKEDLVEVAAFEAGKLQSITSFDGFGTSVELADIAVSQHGVALTGTHDAGVDTTPWVSMAVRNDGALTQAWMEDIAYPSQSGSTAGGVDITELGEVYMTATFMLDGQLGAYVGAFDHQGGERWSYLNTTEPASAYVDVVAEGNWIFAYGASEDGGLISRFSPDGEHLADLTGLADFVGAAEFVEGGDLVWASTLEDPLGGDMLISRVTTGGTMVWENQLDNVQTDSEMPLQMDVDELGYVNVVTSSYFNGETHSRVFRFHP